MCGELWGNLLGCFMELGLLGCNEDRRVFGHSIGDSIFQRPFALSISNWNYLSSTPKYQRNTKLNTTVSIS